MLRIVVVANGRGLVAKAAAQNRWVAEVIDVTTRRGKGEACTKAAESGVAATMVAKSRNGVQNKVNALFDVAVCIVLDEGRPR